MGRTWQQEKGVSNFLGECFASYPKAITLPTGVSGLYYVFIYAFNLPGDFSFFFLTYMVHQHFKTTFEDTEPSKTKILLYVRGSFPSEGQQWLVCLGTKLTVGKVWNLILAFLLAVVGHTEWKWTWVRKQNVRWNTWTYWGKVRKSTLIKLGKSLDSV